MTAPAGGEPEGPDRSAGRQPSREPVSAWVTTPRTLIPSSVSVLGAIVAVMPVTFVECDHDPEFEQAVLRGLEAVSVHNTDVRVCGDFSAAVSEFVGRPYEAERPGGVVGGRTLATADEGSVIFLNARALDDPNGREGMTLLQAVERLAAHEGCHVAMLGRGEELSEDELPGLSVVTHLMRQFTGIVIAEFRAERAVRLAGYPSPSHASDRLVSVVMEMFSVVRDPDCADPLVFAQSSAPICQGYLVDLAIAAAWGEVLGPPELLPLFDKGNSSRLHAALQDLPPADAPLAHFHDVLDGLTPLVVDALLDVGFEWTEEPNGAWGFYRRASDELVDRREATTGDWYAAQTQD